MSYRKKLIEVALPLEAISKATEKEKTIRHGNLSSLHHWWSRKPLAAVRAVLFASLVDDPSETYPNDEKKANKERQRLFRIIEKLVKWENINNEEVLEEARKEILKSTDGNPPPVIDPFCGGGSIPLEAQRLGLKSYGSDLNPVAVMITKALIEIPAKFVNLPPVNPEKQNSPMGKEGWKGTAGLVEDIRYYGKWIRDEAEKRIGHIYPKGPNGEHVISWIWVRTVKCPNPACGVQMPLTSKFQLSKKKGNKAWIEPVIDKDIKTINFEVRLGEGKPREGTVNRSGAYCIVCNTPVTFDYIRDEGKAGRMGQQMMAIAFKGSKKRVYSSPLYEHTQRAFNSKPTWKPDTDLPEKALGFRVQLYGMTKHSDLFTSRQLLVLTTFCDLVKEVKEIIYKDALKSCMADDGQGINSGGNGTKAYSEAVITYLAFAIDKQADLSNSLCRWEPVAECPRQLFGRQAIPMIWDFAEGNPLCESSGSFLICLENIIKGFVNATKSINSKTLESKVIQQDVTLISSKDRFCISTDPPYYDNIGYADLSDFFYTWLRRNIGDIYPDIFRTMLVPKEGELIATPHRFNGDKKKAEGFFHGGLSKAFTNIKNIAHCDYPVTVYYAFKQAEEDTEGQTSSTGWETMLQGLMDSGFQINGTWPMRTECASRMVGQGTNALASSIVLVCRPRPSDAPVTNRRQFLSILRKEFPVALKKLLEGGIAPVDMTQASIGPGMAIFSQYSKVLESDGSPMTVKSALQVINQEIDAYFSTQEGDMDKDTRFCLAWYEQYGFEEAQFGEADVLARAKNTSVEGIVKAGVLEAKKGKVRLLKRTEYKENWDPELDPRVTVWECVNHLIKRLETAGEEGAAKLLNKLTGDYEENSRSLAYRLYLICEKKGWTEEAIAYNTLVISWSAVQEKAVVVSKERKQLELFE